MTLFNSPLEAFLYWEKNMPDLPFLRQFTNTNIQTFSYKQAGNQARRIASGLNSFNLPKKSHIALLSKNCAHWVIADLAIMMADHISIPISPSINAETLNKILIHSDSNAIIIGKLNDFELLKSGIPNIPTISIGAYGLSEGIQWEDVLQNNQPLKEIHKQQKEDLITICYTSGSTRTSKGVMHTAGNFIESGYAFSHNFRNTKNPKLPEHPKFFSYLALAHITERIMYTVNALILGGEISFPDSVETFSNNLKVAKPDLFYAVPRIWIQFKEGILANIPQNRLDIILKTPGIKSLFKTKLKQKIGLNKALYLFSGGANLDANLIKWFEALDIILLQGYGGTEDCMVTHCNFPTANKKGTVGKILLNTKSKLSEDGEIFVKSNNLMKGYYKEPDLTKKVFDKDGYFKTGDIGTYDKEGYLTITGRKKAIFKTTKGKYVSPECIELKLNENINTKNICVVGEGLMQPIALINLSKVGKQKAEHQVAESLFKTVFILNNSLEKYKKIEKIIVVKDDWTQNTNLVTHTIKLKRHNIEKHYESKYKNWYQKKDKVIFEK